MWVVVRFLNSDGRGSAKRFYTKRSAENCLQQDWENDYNMYIANPNISVNTNLTYHEDDYAILSTDNGNRIEWWIARTNE